MTSNELEIFKQSILDDVRVMMQTTGQVTQYIGARYVPLFADPLEWSSTIEYEPLTIVLYQGNSYTSRQFVPKGVDISDTSFWANTGNYNAQIEQYRQEVAAFDARITTAQNTADSKAPINHASDSTEYGVANSTNYGHVKLDTKLSDSDSNGGVAATPKMVKDCIEKNVVIFGDSWAANAPGIGIGQKIFDALTGPKNLVGNFAVAGAQFGNAENATGLHTASQLDVSKSKLSEEQRSKITHVIMVAGVNNVGAKIPTVDLVNKCWTNFKTAFPNAQMYWLYSSMRCIYNGTTQGNVSRVQYDTFTSGARMAGVTVFENSLVWLKTTNEASFWDGAADNARHPNSAGIATFAKIGAAAIESGYDPQFITTVPIQLEEAFQGGNNYADAYMIGTMVHIHMVLVSENFKSTPVKVAKIKKLCWVTPQSYTQVPCAFNEQTKVGYAIMDGMGNISIKADEKPASFAVVDMTYRIM